MFIDVSKKMGCDADRNPHYHRMKDIAMMIKNSDGGSGGHTEVEDMPAPQARAATML